MVTPAKLTYTHSAPLESAAQWLGKPEPGFRLFGFTKAQFSMLDVVLALVNLFGPAERMDAATWTVGGQDVPKLLRLKQEGLIGEFRIVCDRSFPSMKPERCVQLEQALGAAAWRCTNNHAKVVALYWPRGGAVAIHTSGNMNTSIRCENICVEDSAEVAAHITALVSEVFAAMPEGFEWPEKLGTQAFRAITFGEVSKPVVRAPVYNW